MHRRFSLCSYPDPKVLANASESTAFLILAWQEMFDPYVPDTFQPRLLNLPLLIRELESVASKAAISARWQPHVKAIQSEIARVLASERPFLTGIPYLLWAAEAVCKKTLPEEIKEIAKTLTVHERRFQQLAQSELQVAVAGLPQLKEAALRALRRLATMAVNAGFREDDFLDLCEDGNFTRPALDWVNDLIGRTDSSRKQNERDYRCTFAINADAKLLATLAHKLRFQMEKPESVPSALTDLAPTASYVSIQVRAKTPSEALQLATRTVRPALDIFNFYSRSYSLTMCADALVTPTGTTPLLLKVGAQSLRKLPTRRSAPRLAARAVEAIMPRLLTGQILNALEHYTLAQTSSAYRVKLVNLWGAMECLAITPKGGTVMDRVQATTIPIVTWRRVDKITRYVATTLTDWRTKGFATPLGPGFVAEGVVSAEEVLLALCRPDNHPDIDSLLRAVAPNPALRNRIFSLWKIFSDPDALLNDTLTSQQRTSWQLLRIYRARNLIVHYGEEVSNVPHLLDHLQYYFSLTLSRILDSLSSHEQWTVADAVAHWTLREGYLLHQLKHEPSTLRVRDFFPRPIRRLDEVLWPQVAASG